MSDFVKQKPINIRDKETGEVKYTLEFNRKTIRMAEQQGMNLNELGSKPLSVSQQLFYYAFKMHHRFVEKAMTDELLAELGGIQNEELFNALLKLYDQGMGSMADGEEKNSKYALDL